MGKHPVHKLIGDLISLDPDIKKSGFDVLLSPECGGKQNIPLFCENIKSNANELCNVDIALIKNNEIRAIIEIEESDVKPSNFCGKYLTSELSEYHINKSGQSYPIKKPVIFIHIYDKSKLKVNGSKVKQFNNVERLINRIICYNCCSKIKEYYIFDHTYEVQIIGRILSFISRVI